MVLVHDIHPHNQHTTHTVRLPLHHHILHQHHHITPPQCSFHRLTITNTRRTTITMLDLQKLSTFLLPSPKSPMLCMCLRTFLSTLFLFKSPLSLPLRFRWCKHL